MGDNLIHRDNGFYTIKYIQHVHVFLTHPMAGIRDGVVAAHLLRTVTHYLLTNRDFIRKSYAVV